MSIPDNKKYRGYSGKNIFLKIRVIRNIKIIFSREHRLQIFNVSIQAIQLTNCR